MSGYDSDEDEDLKQAIALSLAGLDSTPENPIDLTGDDGVTERGREKKSNMASESCDQQSSKTDEVMDQPENAINPSAAVVAPRFGILALDRKKMEEERLARSRKRNASVSPNHESRLSKVAKTSTNAEGVTSLSQQPSAKIKVNAVHQATTGSEVMSYTQQQTARQTGIQYPKGVVKKTWAYGCPREQDIKIEEVLQKESLELAVLSAFQWDDEWLASKLDSKTRLVCVLGTEDEEHRSFMRTNSPPGIRYIFPSMEGQINCMHAKLLILSHPTHLRIVLPSANLVPYDWGESGCNENVVFLIDLPRRLDGKINSLSELTQFGKELLYFLEALGMEETMRKSLLKFDFKETNHLAFVHSIGGAHSGDAYKRTGYCGLGNAIRELGLSTSDLELDYVASSIGSLNDSFLTTLFLAARGDDGMTAYNWKYGKLRGKKQAKNSDEAEIVEKMRSCFRVYFPTKKTIVESRGGKGAAGTICLQSQWWNNAAFPRSIFRDCQSRRIGMLMHNKILYARPRSLTNMNTSAFVAWSYVGSHNLSASAWGTLVKDKETQLPKMNCRNWECGVVVPIPSPQTAEAGSGTFFGMEIFDGIVPVPMKVGEEYGRNTPWFFKEG